MICCRTSGTRAHPGFRYTRNTFTVSSFQYLLKQRRSIRIVALLVGIVDDDADDR